MRQDIRSFELIRDERDTPEEHEELKKAIETMLKNAGYWDSDPAACPFW